MESNSIPGSVGRVLCFIDEFENVYRRLGTPEKPVESVTLTGDEVRMLGCLITHTIANAMREPDADQLFPLFPRLEKILRD